jgi:CheY-like chemotaxis protein
MSEAGTIVGGRRRLRVLVVDDYYDARDLMRLALEPEGFEVLTAENGLEAVQKTREESPDLVLLNYLMPVMDGFEACRILKADAATRAVPVIAHSACADPVTREAAFASGADDFLCVPFRRRDLIERVRAALGHGPPR